MLVLSISSIDNLLLSVIFVSMGSTVWLGYFDLISLELGSKQRVYRLSMVLRLYLVCRYG